VLYEHLCLTTDDNDTSFNEEKKKLRKFDIAVKHKRQFKCYYCQQSVTRVGPLSLVRRREEDSWHLLNVEAVCQRCFSRVYR
jgi:hypothetical protein